MNVFDDKKLFMDSLNCREKPKLAKQLLAHDQKMINSMYNITFEIIKEYILTMGKFSVERFANQEELLKSLELFYEKDKNKARVLIITLVAEIASQDKRLAWESVRVFHDSFKYSGSEIDDDYDNSANEIKIDKFGELFSKVLKEYPEYALTVRSKIIKRACRLMKLNHKKLFAELDMTNASKKMLKAIEGNNSQGVFMAMANKAFAENTFVYVPNKENDWFDQDEEKEQYEKHVEWLSENFSDKSEMASSLLLLRLK